MLFCNRSFPFSKDTASSAIKKAGSTHGCVRRLRLDKMQTEARKSVGPFGTVRIYRFEIQNLTEHQVRNFLSSAHAGHKLHSQQFAVSQGV